MSDETKQKRAREHVAANFGWFACGLFLVAVSQCLPLDLASVEARSICLFFGVVILAVSVGLFAESLARVILGVDHNESS